MCKCDASNRNQKLLILITCFYHLKSGRNPLAQLSSPMITANEKQPQSKLTRYLSLSSAEYGMSVASSGVHAPINSTKRKAGGKNVLTHRTGIQTHPEGSGGAFVTNRHTQKKSLSLARTSLCHMSDIPHDRQQWADDLQVCWSTSHLYLTVPTTPILSLQSLHDWYHWV